MYYLSSKGFLSQKYSRQQLFSHDRGLDKMYACILEQRLVVLPPRLHPIAIDVYSRYENIPQ